MKISSRPISNSSLSLTLIVTLLLTLVPLSTQSTVEVSQQFPQQITTTLYTQSLQTVNVTVGQNFIIGIPQFDIQKVPDQLKIYEITQEKFMNMFETLEKHRGKGGKGKEGTEVETEDGDIDGMRKEIDKSIFQCQVKSPTMEIVRTLNVYSQKPADRLSFTQQQSMIYVPVISKQLLYTFDTTNMELSVYHFTTQKLNFLSSIKVNSFKNDKKIVMASSSDEQQIFVFSNEGMWRIKTKTVLTNIQRLSTGLNSFSTLSTPIDQLFHGTFGYLPALTLHSSLHLIPESPSSPLQPLSISTFAQIPLIPQSLSISSRFLFLLDLHQGIFIYRILGNGKVQQYDHIVWTGYENLGIEVKEEGQSIFVRYKGEDGGIGVVEIQYDWEKRVAWLVRYYKMDGIGRDMKAITVPVGMPNQGVLNVPFLAVISDSGDIQLFPYRIDPRVQLSAHNGVKMHLESVKNIFYIYQDLYLVTTPTNLLYLKIHISPPTLHCHLPSSTGHIFYSLSFPSVLPSCQPFSPSLPSAPSPSFSSSCTLTSSYMIYIDDPDLSRMQKGILYGIVFIVVGIFIAGIMCLIQWRNSQLGLIGRIKEEIVRIRERYRRMTPFVQEDGDAGNGARPNGRVEFQLPEALPIPERG